MDTLNLTATIRDLSVKPNVVRAGNRITAVYYGEDVKNLDLTLDYQEFRKVFLKGGQNTVIDIELDGKKHKALVHDIQYNPITDRYSHIDFIAVDLNKEVTTHIPLKFVGESEAVRMYAGILVTQLDQVTVTCLAKNLIHEIEVDLAQLKDFTSVIHLSDLVVPEGITIEGDLSAPVAIVEEPKTVEELQAEEDASKAAADQVLEAVKAEPVAEEGADDKKEKSND